jgi:hypothetical protein
MFRVVVDPAWLTARLGIEVPGQVAPDPGKPAVWLPGGDRPVGHTGRVQRDDVVRVPGGPALFPGGGPLPGSCVSVQVSGL